MSTTRPIDRRAAGLLIASAFAPRLAAAAEPVDVRLVLAVDTSGSVNRERFELQKQGYAAAFRSQDVRDAIRAGRTHAVAVTMTHWTGPSMQVVVVPWQRIADNAGADLFAARILDADRALFTGGTSVSGAIDHARSLFPSCPFPGPRSVIDVSGDGANNRGRPAALARDEAVAAGITINGLPILALEPFLDDYYRDNVVGGEGAFMIAAKTYEAFAGAVRRKLILEMS